MNSMKLDFSRSVITSIVIHGSHGNRERVVPHLFADVKYYLIFNQEPVRLWVDGNVSEIPAYCCILWDNAHEVYYHGLTRSMWRGSWIFAQEEEVAREIAAGGIQVKTPYRFLYEDTALRYFWNLYEECTAYRESDDDIIRLWLRGLFLELRRIQNKGDGGGVRVPSPLLEARAFIEANLMNPELSLPRIAAVIHQAPNYFSRCFRAHFGMSPIQYLIVRRLELAKRYLQRTDLPVSEVARKVGYPDQFHFSKLFRQHVGVSPSQFRHEKACCPHGNAC